MLFAAARLLARNRLLHHEVLVPAQMLFIGRNPIVTVIKTASNKTLLPFIVSHLYPPPSIYRFKLTVKSATFRKHTGQSHMYKINTSKVCAVSTLQTNERRLTSRFEQALVPSRWFCGLKGAARSANIEVTLRSHELLRAQHVLPEFPAALQSLSLWSSLSQATTKFMCQRLLIILC